MELLVIAFQEHFQQIAWEKFPSMDCFTRQGADPLDNGPYSSNISLAGCKAACARDPACEGMSDVLLLLD